MKFKSGSYINNYRLRRNPYLPQSSEVALHIGSQFSRLPSYSCWFFSVTWARHSITGFSPTRMGLFKTRRRNCTSINNIVYLVLVDFSQFFFVGTRLLALGLFKTFWARRFLFAFEWRCRFHKYGFDSVFHVFFGCKSRRKGKWVLLTIIVVNKFITFC